VQIEQIVLYFDSLRNQFSFLGRDYDLRCDEWLNLFEQLDGDPGNWGESELPILLSLVHQQFYHDRRGQDIRESLNPPHSKRIFSRRGLTPEICGIGVLVPGATCPYWRGEILQSDHLWPHSLGGATTEENRLSLCGDCNSQKSHSPLLFPRSISSGMAEIKSSSNSQIEV